jgi:dolichol-phosphate mannosyltransferase
MALAVIVKAMGYTIAEVPITFVDRVYGDFKISASDITEYVMGVVKLWLKV